MAKAIRLMALRVNTLHWLYASGRATYSATRSNAVGTSSPLALRQWDDDLCGYPTVGPTYELLTKGGPGVTHDTKGNMLFIPASLRANTSPLVLTWDFGNRMVSAEVGADSMIDVTHQYDALGRRVARTASGSTTVFLPVDQ